MPLSLIIGLGIGCIALVIGLVVRYEKKRREGFQRVAEELGLPFYPKGDADLLSTLNGFPLFSQGHSRKMKNLLYGQIDDGDVAVFGYRYTTRSGENSATFRQNVVYFRSSDMDLPRFTLRPEHMFHRIGSVMGYQDIDFDSHPNFSKRYLLRGDDENAIRATFTDAILTFFESQNRICIEAGGDQLIFYRTMKRVKPREVVAFLEEASRALKQFKTS